MGIFDYIIRSTKTNIQMRQEKMDKASQFPLTEDLVSDLAYKMHSKKVSMMIMRRIDIAENVRGYMIVPNGVNKELPIFEAGQYAVISFKIGDKEVSRPFQIATAPSSVKSRSASIQVILRDLSDLRIWKFIYDNWNIGTIVDLKMPYGDFYYEPLRDTSMITAIVAGNGVTSVFALAKEIVAGKLEVKMNIIVGASKIANTLFYRELNELMVTNANIRIIYVFSEEPTNVGERGVINPEIIRNNSLENSTYFVSGNSELCSRTLRQLMELGVRGKRIKWNLTRIGRPKDNETEYYITVMQGVKKEVIKCRNYETISVCLERNGYATHINCGSGKCGFCRSELIEGDIYTSKLNDYRRDADVVNNIFHPCVSYPVSNLVIRIPI